MRTFWILFGVLVSTSAIVHKQVKRTDGHTLDKENEISSESLNTGEFIPLKESNEDDYEVNAGEVGYKYEVPEELDKIEKPLLKIKEKSAEISKSQKYEPITRSPDPYISAQSSSMKYYPPSTSYGTPFYNTYPVPMKFKSVTVVHNSNSHVNKFKHPQSYYITEKKYPKLYKEETKNMKTNNLGTFRNTNESFDYGTEDYLQGHESSQLEPYDTNVKSEFDFEKTSGNVYYIDGHEFPPEPNNYGTLFTNNHEPEQDEYNSNGFDGYKNPKLDEDEKKYNFPKIENVYVSKGYNYGAMKEFGDGPGNGFFFTMYPKYSPKKNERYVYEVPLKYKSLLFNGNGQMYKKSMQFQGMESDGFSGLHTSSEFESPWIQVGKHFTQNQEYLRPSAFQSSYGNKIYGFRKPDPSYIVYKIYKHKF